MDCVTPPDYCWSVCCFGRSRSINSKGISANFGKGLGFGLKRHIPTLEEKQIATQAGQKEVPPEIKQKLDQFAKDAKRRKDEERAPEDYLVLAGEALDEKKFEDGLRLAYTGLHLEPKDKRTRAGLYNIIAVIYDDLKSHFLAEKNYRKAIQSDDTFSVPHYNLGNLYKDQKKYELAEASFNKALILDPDYKEAQENLDKLRKMRGGDKD